MPDHVREIVSQFSFEYENKQYQSQVIRKRLNSSPPAKYKCFIDEQKDGYKLTLRTLMNKPLTAPISVHLVYHNIGQLLNYGASLYSEGGSVFIEKI